MSEVGEKELLKFLKVAFPKYPGDSDSMCERCFMKESCDADELKGSQTTLLPCHAARRTIRRLIETKPRVTREFVAILAGEISTSNFQKKPPNEVFDLLLKRFYEAGIEVEEDKETR